jgi:hypothetical protein
MSNTIFILSITVFFLAVIQLSALFGVSFLGGNIEFVAPSEAPTGILEGIAFFFLQFGVFFQLMTVSSEFLIFGSVLIIGYTIAMLWAIAELVATALP